MNQVKYTSPFGTKVVMDFTYNHFRADDCFCKEPEVKPGTVSKTDIVTLVQTDALPTYNDRMMYRDQVKASGSFFTKRHDIRFGAEWLKGGEKLRTWATSSMTARYSSGVPNSVIAYALPVTKSSDPGGPDIPLQNEQWSRDVNTYLQDRYTVVRRLVVNLGLRYEMNRSWQPAACRPGSEFLPVADMPNGGCYPEVDYAPKFNGLSPRFNMVYDLMGDGKTAIKFAANKYHDSINISVVSALNSVGTLSNTRPWTVCAAGQTISCDLNGDKIPQMNEIAPLAYNIPAVTRNPYEGKIKWPGSYEFSAEIQRQLPGGMVTSIGVNRTLYRDQLGTRNTAVPPSAYTAVNVTEKVTGKPVTVYFRDPSYNGVATNNVSFTTPLLNSEYTGLDITLNKRMSNRWSFTGGASFGRTVAHTVDSDLNNPTNRAFDSGVTAGSRPWSYRLSGVYQAPFNWIASGTFVFDKGPGETTSVVVGTDTIAFPAGNGTTQTVTVAKREDTCCNVSAADGWTPVPDQPRAARHEPAADVPFPGEHVRASPRLVQRAEQFDGDGSGDATRSHVPPRQRHSGGPDDQGGIQLRVLTTKNTKKYEGHEERVGSESFPPLFCCLITETQRHEDPQRPNARTLRLRLGHLAASAWPAKQATQVEASVSSCLRVEIEKIRLR